MAESSLKRQKLSTDSYVAQTILPMNDLYKEKYSISKGEHSVNSIKISPDGTKFATGSSDTTVKVFNLNDGELLAELIGHTKGISDIEFSPTNSNIIASCSDDLTIRLWSIKKKQCLKVLKKHTYHVTAVKFSLKGNILISGSADETITIWDIISGITLKTLAAHSDPVLSLALTPDSTMIASASYDGLMRLFDLETGQCLKTLTYNSSSHGTATASTADVVNFPISNVEFSPNGKYILSSSLDGVLRLWDYMNNKVIKTYLGLDGGEVPISEAYNCSAKFITKTKDPLIISGSDKSGILVWDVQSKKIAYQFENSGEPVFDIDTYDEGRIIAACSKNGAVSIMEMNPKYFKPTEMNPDASSLPESPASS
ncbi:uncharacterized protein AC631_03639 [Debaryomyces fabryi]|uniref:WDR5-like beta-propeller domain-containing protein n=1 Tax=Debaryomyces fabryi TaxID=58627 RepID=A0A0V1PWP8_9ASCO|nr:uncharacterized protein AC631_03639 [Debaryomyces fabryi]KSA00594.1 hypothetical protein AC631_03639 [Debaryomyces fabryi]CUM56196.1 unnamed protein product [Debaryomyces fabryi]